MPFVRKTGIKGLIWMPARRGPMKHPCRDCYRCAWCSDERCASCLADETANRAASLPNPEDGRPAAETAEKHTPSRPPESKPPSEEGGDGA